MTTVTINKGDMVYYVRVFKDTTEVEDLKIRTVGVKHFVGVNKSGIAFLLFYKDMDSLIYTDRILAVNKAISIDVQRKGV